MKCKIEYVGKWGNEDVYYCLIHHKKASINGKKLDECICDDKESYDNSLVISKEKIKNIIFTYPDLLHSLKSILEVDGKETNIVYIGKSMLEKRDFGGLLLSRLNNINLETEKCPFCGNIHSDDGKFAYKPHNPHLCAYCGHLFSVKHPNICNELATIFKIPNINFNNGCIEITDKLKIEYDVLNGEVLINNINCDKIKINNEQYNIKDYLNEKLYNEF